MSQRWSSLDFVIESPLAASGVAVMNRAVAARDCRDLIDWADRERYSDLPAASAAVQTRMAGPLGRDTEYTGTVMNNGSVVVFEVYGARGLAALPHPEYLLEPLLQFGFHIDTITS